MRFANGRRALVLVAVAGLAACGGPKQRVEQASEQVREDERAERHREAGRQAAEESAMRELLAELGRDYTIGAGDLLEISIFEWELREQTKTAFFRVTQSGTISLPVVGNLDVGGRSVGAVKALVEDQLRSGGFLLQPRVSVDIAEYRSKRVAVVGAVREPGVFTLRQNATTVLDMLSLAGGLNEGASATAYVINGNTASLGSMVVARPGAESASPGGIQTVDLVALLSQGRLTENLVLRHGDVLNVPEADSFSVIGYVREPGRFPLRQPTTVLEAVALARGFEYVGASPGSAILKRREDGHETVIPIDLTEIAEGRRPDIYLQAGDVVHVPKSGAKSFGQGLLAVLGRIVNFGIFIGR